MLPLSRLVSMILIRFFLLFSLLLCSSLLLSLFFFSAPLSSSSLLLSHSLSADDCKCAIPDEYFTEYGAEYMLKVTGIYDLIQDKLHEDSDEFFTEILRALEDPAYAGEMFSSACKWRVVTKFGSLTLTLLLYCCLAHLISTHQSMSAL